MANMQMREKIKNITAAAKNSENIPEHSKRIGMIIFYILAGLGISAIVVLAFSLFMYGYTVGSLITIIIALLLSLFIYKIKSADDIPKGRIN